MKDVRFGSKVKYMSISRTLGRILTLLGTLGIIGGLVLPYNLKATSGGNKLYEILGSTSTISSNLSSLFSSSKPAFVAVLLLVLGIIFALVGAIAGKRIVGLLGGIFTIVGWYLLIKYYSDITAVTLGNGGVNVLGSVTFMNFIRFGATSNDFSAIKASFTNSGYGYILTVISPLIVLIGSLLITKKKPKEAEAEKILEKEEEEKAENQETYSYAQQYASYQPEGASTESEMGYSNNTVANNYAQNDVETQVMSGGAAQAAMAASTETSYSQQSAPVAAASMETQAQAKLCPKCGGPLDYIQEYDRYYCYNCQEYAPEGY